MVRVRKGRVGPPDRPPPPLILLAPTPWICFRDSVESPQRKHLPHEVPSWVPDGEIYFLTICSANKGSDDFIRNATPSALIRAVRHYHEINRWYAHLFLVMPDHVHGLFCMPAYYELKKSVGAWKSFTAKNSAIRWQRDFFEHRLRDGESYDAKAQYIRMNPVRAGLCESPEDWPHIWSAPR